jgi:hypothetical protein
MRRPAELVPWVEATHAPFPCQDRKVAPNHTSLREEVVVERRGISAFSDQTCSRYCGCCVKCIMQREVINYVYVYVLVLHLPVVDNFHFRLDYPSHSNL